MYNACKFNQSATSNKLDDWFDVIFFLFLVLGMQRKNKLV